MVRNSSIVAAVIFSFILIHESSHAAISEISQKLEDQDVATRRNASEELVNYIFRAISERNLEGLEQSIPIVTRALGDPDGIVRQKAATAASLITTVAHEGRKRNSKELAGLQANEPLRKALFRAITDKDPSVRIEVVRSILLGFEPAPETEKVLLQQLSVEKDPNVRQVIVRSLSEFASPESASALKQALRDETAAVRESAAQSLSRRKSPSALKALISTLKENPSFATDNFLAAIGSYGAEAKPYLPVLEELALREKDEKVKEKLLRTIDQIQKF